MEQLLLSGLDYNESPLSPEFQGPERHPSKFYGDSVNCSA